MLINKEMWKCSSQGYLQLSIALRHPRHPTGGALVPILNKHAYPLKVKLARNLSGAENEFVASETGSDLPSP